MHTLREVYNIKRQLTNTNISRLGMLLGQYTDLDININSDNTLYVESNCGVDFIRNSLEVEVLKLLGVTTAPINMIYNTLPLSNNSCIIRI